MGIDFELDRLIEFVQDECELLTWSADSPFFELVLSRFEFIINDL